MIETGWTRSALMQPTIDARQVEQHAQQADVRAPLRHRLRRPARKGSHPGAQGGLHRPRGSIHLHRARACGRARRSTATWTRNLYGFAIAPHLVFYLKIDERTLIRRVLESRGMNFWESGMDLKLGRRHPRQLPRLPARAAPRIQLDGGRVRVPGARREAQDRRDSGRAPTSDWRIPGRKRFPPYRTAEPVTRI